MISVAVPDVVFQWDALTSLQKAALMELAPGLYFAVARVVRLVRYDDHGYVPRHAVTWDVQFDL